MRALDIYCNNQLAGRLTEYAPHDFGFKYDQTYLDTPSALSISISLPKQSEEFKASSLFPYFTNQLPEGGNRRLLCTRNHVDEHDFFGILMLFDGKDFIGHMSIKKVI